VKYTLLANKAGIFMETDVPECADLRKRRKLALLFQELVFSKIDCGDESYEAVLRDNVPTDWVHVYKNEDGTVQIEIRAYVCAIPEQICPGITITRFPVWSKEPVGVPLWKCVTAMPRAKQHGMQEE